MSQWKKKRSIMRRYDQSAKVYDAQYREEQEAKIKTALENLTLTKDSVVLDAGCGTGLLFKHIAQKTNFVAGADISSGILKEAKKKARTYQNVALIRADTNNLPFSNNSFDVVFAVTLLQNMPNPEETLNEIKRVCKSDATVAATGFKKAFTEEEFLETLKQANLKVAVLKLDEQMREYVCVCFKMRR